jgi:hypothetical protein
MAFIWMSRMNAGEELSGRWRTTFVPKLVAAGVSFDSRMPLASNVFLKPGLPHFRA